MPSVRLPVIENPVYCSILFALGVGKKTASEIAEFLGKDVSSTTKQIKFLCKNNEKYLIKEQDPKYVRRKLYSVNFNKVQESFADYIYQRTKIIDFDFADDRAFVLSFLQDYDRDKKIAIQNNKYLGLFFNIIFKNKYELLHSETKLSHLNLNKLDILLIDLFIELVDNYTWIKDLQTYVVEDLHNIDETKDQKEYNRQMDILYSKDRQATFLMYLETLLFICSNPVKRHIRNDLLPKSKEEFKLNMKSIFSKE